MYELYDPCTIMFFFRNKVHTVGRGGAGMQTEVAAALAAPGAALGERA